MPTNREVFLVIIILSFCFYFFYSSELLWPHPTSSPSATSTQKLAHLEILNRAASPLAPASISANATFDPLTQPWFLRYLEIHKREHAKILRREKPRIVVYRFTEGGWGNRLRAQYFVFLLAVFTERMFLIDHDDMLFHFGDPHPEMTMFWKDLQRDGIHTLGMSSGGIGHAGFRQDLEGMTDLSFEQARNTFNERYPQDMLEYGEGNTPDYAFFKNGPGLLDFLQRTFETTSRFNVSGQITSVMLANPSPALKEAAEMLKKDMKWDSYDRMIVIQLRMFVDYWPSHETIREQLPRIWNKFLGAIESDLTLDIAALQTDRKRIAVWFTTDEASMHAEVIKMIEDRGYSGVLSPLKPTHTSSAPPGLKNSIVEFYLIAETFATFTLGTSFVQFALARTNWSSRFYQFQGWPPNVEEWFGRMPYEHAAVPAYVEYCGLDICF